ncbi:MAG: hypothetical protein H7256_05665 [Bdellovibrio sp.]|nr:hypothetical protein [Bdellovibrio sp.]
MSMMFLIIYGIMTMLENSRLHQKRQTILSNVRELQARIEEVLKDPQAWRNTLMDTTNSSMGCLRTINTAATVACTTGPKTIVVLRDSANNIVIGNLPDWSMATYTSDGFTESGSPCSTFSTSGNDACPFSYKIIWEPRSGIVDPGFRITARFLYSPGATSTKMPLSVGAMSNNPATDTPAINGVSVSPTLKVTNGPSYGLFVHDDTVGKYDVVLWRTAFTTIVSFRAVSVSTSNCSTASITRSGFSAANDPFLVLGAPTTSQIKIKYSGTWDCDIVATGNEVGGFQAQLIESALILGAGTGYAPPGVQAAVDFSSTFVDKYNLDVVQTCSTVGPANALGVNSAGAPLASLTCRLVN